MDTHPPGMRNIPRIQQGWTVGPFEMLFGTCTLWCKKRSVRLVSTKRCQRWLEKAIMHLFIIMLSSWHQRKATKIWIFNAYVLCKHIFKISLDIYSKCNRTTRNTKEVLNSLETSRKSLIRVNVYNNSHMHKSTNPRYSINIGIYFQLNMVPYKVENILLQGHKQ